MESQTNKPTIADVGRLSGVSPATVSRVLNHKSIVKGETYERVLAAIRELGYPFNEYGAEAEPQNGPILFNLNSLDNPFFSEVVMSAKATASRYNHNLLINEEEIRRSNVQNIIDLARKINAAGMILTDTVDAYLLERLSDALPIVQCCECNEEMDISFVSINDVAASKSIMRHLIATGCRRIAFLGGHNNRKCVRHRLLGYQESLQEAGLYEDAGMKIMLSDHNFEMAVAGCMQLLGSSNPPDAFFAASDVFAFAAVRAAHLTGFRVPQDVKVTGFDNIRHAIMSVPSITTVNQPRTQLGSASCELLIEKIKFPDTPAKKMILETELILRESA